MAFLAILQLQMMKQFSVTIQTLYPPLSQHTFRLSLSLHFPILPTQSVEKCYSVQ